MYEREESVIIIQFQSFGNIYRWLAISTTYFADGLRYGTFNSMNFCNSSALPERCNKNMMIHY